MEITEAYVESQLAAGTSLRTLASQMGMTYQSLQYHRRKWGGKPLRSGYTQGEGHASWRGGSFIDRWGYKMVRAPERGKANPYVPEHILIAEQTLGRLLEDGEVVHHINGDKFDNRPENLLVCTRSHHRSLHAQLESIAFELVKTGKVQFVDGQYVRVD